MRRTLPAIFGAGALLLLVAPAFADTFTLEDLNSTAVFDTGTSSSPSGQTTWTIDGVDQVYEQDFWIRVGDDTSTPETRVSSLTLDHAGTGDINVNTGDDVLSLLYGGTGYSVTVAYTLAGGNSGTGTSDLAETITIHNTQTSGSLHFNFFEYVDFDLNDTIGGDYATVSNGNSVQQWDPDANGQVTETVVTPTPSAFELGSYPSILNALNDGDADNLSSSTTSLDNTDVTWAFQWDFNLGAGGSFIISKDKNFALVPLPSAALAGLGLLGLMGASRLTRRRAAV
jgi:hypothetical protein